MIGLAHGGKMYTARYLLWDKGPFSQRASLKA